MPFVDMQNELHGVVPKIPFPFTGTLINRAWRDVRRQNLWSFLIFEDHWSSPPTINGGTCTVTQGSPNVVFDSVTAGPAIQTAFASGVPTPLLQRQFRQGIGGIYNLLSWNGATFTLTLTQPYAEATGAGQAFTIYQAYYPTPMLDFRTWISVRDMVNYIDLFLDKTRAMIDASDPQRTWYYFPTDVVFYQNDPTPLKQGVANPTYHFPLFELWGAPTYNLTYQLYGIRNGVDLVLPTDTLPAAVGEDCVMAKAKYYAYQWAEANKGDLARGQGSDYKFLMGAAEAEYKDLFRSYRREDRETVNNWFSIRRNSLYGKFFAYYSSIGGTAYPGATMGG